MQDDFFREDIKRNGLFSKMVGKLDDIDKYIRQHQAVSHANPASSQIEYNVKDYGAVGDGIVDDTSAIQSAVNYVATIGGGIIFFPAGTYKITSPIVVTSLITLYGAGKAASAIKNFSTSTDAIQIGTASTAATYVLIENLMITSNASMTAGAAINTVYGYQVNIKNIFINDHFYGIVLDDGSFRYLENITILHQSTPPLGAIGILISSGNDDFISGLYIDSTVFSSNAIAGIKVESSSGLWVSNSDILHMNNGLFISPGNAQTAEWLFFDSVAFDSSYASCINITPTGTGIVRGCFFSLCWSASAGLHSATPTWGTDAGVLISGSNVFGTSFIGHRCFYNGGHGFSINLAVDTKIIGSSIAGNGQATASTYDGVSILADTDNFSIMDNRIGPSDNFSDSQNYAISINTGTSDNYIITSNNLQGNVSQISDNGSGTNKIIANNLGVYTGGYGTTSSLVTNATETIIAAGTTPAIYMVNVLSETGGNTAWSGTWMVYVDGNITISNAAAGGGQADCVASGTNIQIKNLNAATVAIKWAYTKIR